MKMPSDEPKLLNDDDGDNDVKCYFNKEFEESK
jgi:hypothetical protein